MKKKHDFDLNGCCKECGHEASASEWAKLMGLPSLMPVVDATGRSRETLYNWRAKKFHLFKLVVIGTVAQYFNHKRAGIRVPVGATTCVYARAYGFKNFKAVMDISCISRWTLKKWHVDNPKLFEIIMLACVELTVNHCVLCHAKQEYLERLKEAS